MGTRTIRKGRIGAVLALVAAFLLGGASYGAVQMASASGTSTTYFACLTKAGALNHAGVTSPTKCASGATVISWNSVGPQGPQGVQGPQGLQGLTGPQGPPVTCSGIPREGIDLSGCDLRGATFAGANLTSVNFANGDLTDASFAGTTLTDADLTSANLGNSDLQGAVSGGIVGTPSTLPPGWSIYGGYLVGPGADLRSNNLSGIDFTNATFTNDQLDSANLSGATLVGASSGGITGSPSALPGSWILYSGYLVGPGANLTNANFSGAQFPGLNLTGANLTGVSFWAGNLIGANLTHANLTNANLASTAMTHAIITGVVWSNTTCGDGTNSNNDGGTCVGHLT